MSQTCSPLASLPCAYGRPPYPHVQHLASDLTCAAFCTMRQGRTGWATRRPMGMRRLTDPSLTPCTLLCLPYIRQHFQLCVHCLLLARQRLILFRGLLAWSTVKTQTVAKGAGYCPQGTLPLGICAPPSCPTARFAHLLIPSNQSTTLVQSRQQSAPCWVNSQLPVRYALPPPVPSLLAPAPRPAPHPIHTPSEVPAAICTTPSRDQAACPLSIPSSPLPCIAPAPLVSSTYLVQYRPS